MKLAIVGAEPHTRHLAPYNDPDYEIWVFNEWANADWCGRWDALIQIHKPEIYKNLNKKDPQHWEFLQRKHNKPIYMQEADPDVPDAVKYPLDDAIAITGERYFRATISYALALAVLKGFEEVHIWGVELTHHAEYKSQRDNFLYWAGALKARGVKLVLHCSYGLFDKPLYGYEENVTESELQEYMVGINQQIEDAKKKLAMLEGALALVQQMLEKGKNVKEVSQPVQA